MENRLSMIIMKKPNRRVIDSIVLELLDERRAVAEQMRLAGNITPTELRYAVEVMKMAEVRPEDLLAVRSLN